jgi:DNA-binding protein H-NS
MKAPTRTAENSELKRQSIAAAQRRAGGRPVAMYRDPQTGASWSGRGLRPGWLTAAIDAGRTMDEFLIDWN